MITRNIFLILKELGFKKIILFGFLNIFVLILELLSFSMFIPLLLTLTSKEKLIEINFFNNILFFFNINPNETNQILSLMLVILILIFLIKNIFIGLSRYFQYRISYNIEINLTSKVFQKYLRKPYLFHTSENSSKALRNIIGETAIFSRAFLGSILNLIIETIVHLNYFYVFQL